MSEKRSSLFSALLMLILVMGMVIWGVNALTNEDPLWFLSSFTAQADWITVYWDGTTHMYFPGDAEYERIMPELAGALAHWSGYENGVGLSDESLETMRMEGRLMEAHFNDPVQVHTRHMFSRVRNFFIPLAGTHASYRRVFGGLTDEPRIGVLNLSEGRFDNLLEAVDRAVR